MEAWKIKESADKGVIVFTYWDNCVTGKAKNYWNAVVKEYHADGTAKTYKTWMSCVGMYLEKLQNMSFIGDAVYFKILRWKRPVNVSFIDFVDRIYELLGYVKDGYLRCSKDMKEPGERAIMNALFKNECRPLCLEYAKTHKQIKGPIDTFKSEMSTLEDADKGSATHQAAIANYRRQELEAKRKASGELRPRDTQTCA